MVLKEYLNKKTTSSCASSTPAALFWLHPWSLLLTSGCSLTSAEAPSQHHWCILLSKQMTEEKLNMLRKQLKSPQSVPITSAHLLVIFIPSGNIWRGGESAHLSSFSCPLGEHCHSICTHTILCRMRVKVSTCREKKSQFCQHRKECCHGFVSTTKKKVFFKKQGRFLFSLIEYGCEHRSNICGWKKHIHSFRMHLVGHKLYITSFQQIFNCSVILHSAHPTLHNRGSCTSPWLTVTFSWFTGGASLIESSHGIKWEL